MGRLERAGTPQDGRGEDAALLRRGGGTGTSVGRGRRALGDSAEVEAEGSEPAGQSALATGCEHRGRGLGVCAESWHTSTSGSTA